MSPSGHVAVTMTDIHIHIHIAYEHVLITRDAPGQTGRSSMIPRPFTG